MTGINCLKNEKHFWKKKLTHEVYLLRIYFMWKEGCSFWSVGQKESGVATPDNEKKQKPSAVGGHRTLTDKIA